MRSETKLDNWRTKASSFFTY